METLKTLRAANRRLWWALAFRFLGLACLVYWFFKFDYTPYSSQQTLPIIGALLATMAADKFRDNGRDLIGEFLEYYENAHGIHHGAASGRDDSTPAL